MPQSSFVAGKQVVAESTAESAVLSVTSSSLLLGAALLSAQRLTLCDCLQAMYIAKDVSMHIYNDAAWILIASLTLMYDAQHPAVRSARYSTAP